MRLRFRANITVWLTLLVLLPLLPLLGFSTYSAYRYTEELRLAVENELRQRTEGLAHEVSDRLAKKLGLMASLALSESALEGDLPALYKSARRTQDAYPGISAITLTSPDKRTLFSTLQPYGEPLESNQGAAVQSVFATGKSVISAPFRSAVSGQMVVALGVPVIHDGKTVYCLQAILDTDVFNKIITPERLPPGWFAAVINREGFLVARSHEPRRYVGEQGSPGVLDALRTNYFGLWEGITKEGVRTQTVMRTVGAWNWFVVLGVPIGTLNKPLNQEITQLALIGSLLLALGILAAMGGALLIRQALHDTVKSTQAVLRGEPPNAGRTGVNELDQMHAALTQVDEYSRLLEQRVTLRTAELVKAKERIAQFAIQLEDSVESERQRISREVHDQIGAVLTGIKLILNSLPKGSLVETQQKSMVEALDAGVATARRITAELRPPLLDDLGLQAATEQLLENTFGDSAVDFAARLTDYACLSERQSLAVYRIFQEACTNVIRHAHASHFVVAGQKKSDNVYEITMTDDGVGMPSTPPRQGALGVVGMQERAELLGGTLDIATQAQKGVVLVLRLPIASHMIDASDENPAA